MEIIFYKIQESNALGVDYNENLKQFLSEQSELKIIMHQYNIIYHNKYNITKFIIFFIKQLQRNCFFLISKPFFFVISLDKTLLVGANI